MKMVAVRTVRLCTKDCLCLYVCPTGATDTEDSIIDVNKCNGCGVCVQACPSSAISLVPTEYPQQQSHTDDAVNALDRLSKSKTEQEIMARTIAGSAVNDGLYRLMKAFELSNRLMAEDVLRESGYMLPQSANTHFLLRRMIDEDPEGLPKDAAEGLLDSIVCNEPIARYCCGYCGKEFEHSGKGDISCPLCRTSGDSFRKV